jgi:cytochrome c553
LLRALGISLGVFAVFLVAAVSLVYVISGTRLGKRYPIARYPLTVHNDSASVARGAHLFRILSCTLCHGDDGGGKVYADMGPVGIVAGPNLTSGRGGIGGTLGDSDFGRALRSGVRRDGTSLILMPSEVFVYLTDEDLGAIAAYVKQLAPVDRQVPQTRFRVLGRTLLAMGKMDILPAPKTPQLTPVASISRNTSKEYGRYLANVAGCHGCHGFGLSGGRVAGPAGLPPASNLTPAGSVPTLKRTSLVPYAKECVQEARRSTSSCPGGISLT